MATVRKRGDKWQVQVRRQGFEAVSRSFSQRRDAERWGTLKEREFDLLESQGHVGRKTCDLMVARHAGIAHHFGTGVGLDLQRLDSDIALEVVNYLAVGGIVALPIHDSFIVQERHRGEAKEAMVLAYRAVLHRTPEVDELGG